MAETADYDPGDWKGYDFKSARAVYDAHAGRSYTDAKSKKIDASALIPDKVETKSTAPLVIACDVTGSMGEWPAVIFSKLPYLDLEGKEYLGEGLEISFAAVGDIYSDDYPLQIRPFSKGTDLTEQLKKLVVEGNGGGQYKESYDVAAAYYARNCEMPNAIQPIFIFIGDEGLYDFLDKEGASKWARTDEEGRFSVEQIIGELKRKFSVYLVRKPYGSGYKTNKKDDLDIKIQRQWEELLGEDHVCHLPDASRVVDVIFGILAKETGRVDYFKKELKDRQKPEQVSVVMKSLNSIHALPPAASLKKLGDGRSITRRVGKDDDGMQTKPLI